MLINKIRQKGLFGTLKATISILKSLILRLVQYRNFELINYSINFIHEGSKIVKIPRVPFVKVLLGIGILVKKNIYYATRPHEEVLLRKTIFELYESGYIDKTRSIIDIGSWISDNSIVWAQFLSDKGCVFAIDPSSDNIAYGKILADLNDVKNIKFVQAVCAEKPGIRLDFDGPDDNFTFKETTSEKYIKSTTIDQIVTENDESIGFFHVDVEGLELSVLKGAENVIKRDLPVILFEQHISKEKVSEVISYLKNFGYRIFMINEVVPDSDLDCRNFLALPSEKGVPKLSNFEQSDGRDLGIFSAVVGETIIEL